jgi:hypothetical protein
MKTNTNLGKNRCCNIPNPPKGPVGQHGTGGPIGTIGPTGYTGPTGHAGPTGICYRGPKGPQGPKGPTTGLIGPTGTPGAYIVNFNSNFKNNTLVQYNNSSFTNISSKQIILPLAEQKWAISWEIVEKCNDTNNKFYIYLEETYNTSNHYYPNTFSTTHPHYLYSGNNNNNLYGSGNDYLDLSTTIDNYFTIKLMQTTSSGAKSITTSNFNITFTQIL